MRRMHKSPETIDPYRDCPDDYRPIIPALLLRGSPDRDLSFVATELSTSIDWPETGLGEINGDLPEAHFGTTSSESRVKNVTSG